MLVAWRLRNQMWDSLCGTWYPGDICPQGAPPPPLRVGPQQQGQLPLRQRLCFPQV